MKIYLHLKIKEKSMIRNKTLLFSLGCFVLFSIFSSDAKGKSALPQKIYPNRECITTKKCNGQINPLYLSFYDADYKNVCDAIGKFIGAKRVDSSEFKVKFLPFDYDRIIANLTEDGFTSRNLYGAFECRGIGSCIGLLFADIDGDNKKELILKYAGYYSSLNDLDTKLVRQGIEVLDLFPKEDPDYDIVMENISTVLQKVLEFNRQYETALINKVSGFRPATNNILQILALITENRDNLNDNKLSSDIQYKIKNVLNQIYLGTLAKYEAQSNKVADFYPLSLLFYNENIRRTKPNVKKVFPSAKVKYFPLQYASFMLTDYSAIELFSIDNRTYLYQQEGLIFDWERLTQIYKNNKLPSDNFRYLRDLQSLGWYSDKIAYTYRPEVTIWAGKDGFLKPICSFTMNNNGMDKPQKLSDIQIKEVGYY